MAQRNSAHGVWHSQSLPSFKFRHYLITELFASFPQKPNQDKASQILKLRKSFTRPSFNLIAYKWKSWNSPKRKAAFHFYLTKFLVSEHQDKNFPNNINVPEDFTFKINFDFFFNQNFYTHRDKFLQTECFPLFTGRWLTVTWNSLTGGRKAFPSPHICLEVALCWQADRDVGDGQWNRLFARKGPGWCYLWQRQCERHRFHLLAQVSKSLTGTFITSRKQQRLLAFYFWSAYRFLPTPSATSQEFKGRGRWAGFLFKDSQWPAFLFCSRIKKFLFTLLPSKEWYRPLPSKVANDKTDAQEIYLYFVKFQSI